eukprot:g2034.t1
MFRDHNTQDSFEKTAMLPKPFNTSQGSFGKAEILTPQIRELKASLSQLKIDSEDCDGIQHPQLTPGGKTSSTSSPRVCRRAFTEKDYNEICYTTGTVPLDTLVVPLDTLVVPLDTLVIPRRSQDMQPSPASSVVSYGSTPSELPRIDSLPSLTDLIRLDDELASFESPRMSLQPMSRVFSFKDMVESVSERPSPGMTPIIAHRKRIRELLPSASFDDYQPSVSPCEITQACQHDTVFSFVQEHSESFQA